MAKSGSPEALRTGRGNREKLNELTPQAGGCRPDVRHRLARRTGEEATHPPAVEAGTPAGTLTPKPKADALAVDG